VAAVEFAIVALALLTFLLVLIETGMQLLTQAVLDYGVREVSRFGVTGAPYQSGAPQRHADRVPEFQCGRAGRRHERRGRPSGCGAVSGDLSAALPDIAGSIDRRHAVSSAQRDNGGSE
jgi:hypothetical protein